MRQNGAGKSVQVQLGVEGASREPFRYALLTVPLQRKRTDVARIENANASGSRERRLPVLFERLHDIGPSSRPDASFRVHVRVCKRHCLSSLKAATAENPL